MVTQESANSLFSQDQISGRSLDKSVSEMMTIALLTAAVMLTWDIRSTCITVTLGLSINHLWP